MGTTINFSDSWRVGRVSTNTGTGLVHLHPARLSEACTPLKPHFKGLGTSVGPYFAAYKYFGPSREFWHSYAAQHVEHGKPISVNNDQNRPFAHHRATASSNGVSSRPHVDSVILPKQ